MGKPINTGHVANCLACAEQQSKIFAFSLVKAVLGHDAFDLFMPWLPVQKRSRH